MAQLVTARKRIRKSFGRIPEVTVMPNLIEVQRQSYENFLQMHVPAPQRELAGLEEVFRSIFPIKDFADRAALDGGVRILADGANDVQPRVPGRELVQVVPVVEVVDAALAERKPGE